MRLTLMTAAATLLVATPAIATVNVTITTGNPLTSKIYDISATDTNPGYGSLGQNTTNQDVVITPNTPIDVANGFSTIKEYVAKKDTAAPDWISLIVDPNVDYSKIQYSIQLVGDGTVSMYYELAGTNTFTLWGSFDQQKDKHIQYLMDGGDFNSLKFIVSGTIFKEVKQISIEQLPAALPEPGTWAMMMVGFGGIGLTLRRSRRNRRLLQIA